MGKQRQVELSVNWRHIVVQRSLNFWFSWSAKLIFYEIVVLYWAWTVRRRRAAAARRDGPWLASAVLEDVISWSKIQMTRGTWNVSARSIDRFEQFSVFVYGLCCSLHRVDIKEGSSKQFPTWILNFWPCGQYFNYAKVCYFWWLFSFFYGHSSHCSFLTEKLFFFLWSIVFWAKIG